MLCGKQFRLICYIQLFLPNICSQKYLYIHSTFFLNLSVEVISSILSQHSTINPECNLFHFFRLLMSLTFQTNNFTYIGLFFSHLCFVNVAVTVVDI